MRLNKHAIWSASICCFLSISGCAFAASEEPISLENKVMSPLGESRILASCSLKGEAPALPEVKWEEFEERDLIFLEIRDEYVQAIVGKTISDDNRSVTTTYEKRQHAVPTEELRRVANCDEEHSYVLIGKDTTAKNRWRGDVSQKELFQIIDAMPMRRFEMTQKAKKN